MFKTIQINSQPAHQILKFMNKPILLLLLHLLLLRIHIVNLINIQVALIFLHLPQQLIKVQVKFQAQLLPHPELINLSILKNGYQVYQEAPLKQIQDLLQFLLIFLSLKLVFQKVLININIQHRVLPQLVSSEALIYKKFQIFEVMINLLLFKFLLILTLYHNLILKYSNILNIFDVKVIIMKCL